MKRLSLGNVQRALGSDGHRLDGHPARSPRVDFLDANGVPGAVVDSEFHPHVGAVDFPDERFDHWKAGAIRQEPEQPREDCGEGADDREEPVSHLHEDRLHHCCDTTGSARQGIRLPAWSVWSLDAESRAIYRDEIQARTAVEAAEAVVWPGHLVLAVFPVGVSDELGLSRALHRSMVRDATRGAV